MAYLRHLRNPITDQTAGMVGQGGPGPCPGTPVLGQFGSQEATDPQSPRCLQRLLRLLNEHWTADGVSCFGHCVP